MLNKLFFFIIKWLKEIDSYIDSYMDKYLYPVIKDYYYLALLYFSFKNNKLLFIVVKVIFKAILVYIVYYIYEKFYR